MSATEVTDPHINLSHVMVDLETYDTEPSAVILSIGACVVCADPEVMPLFYAELDVTQQGRTQSIDTLNWWATQGNCPNSGNIPLLLALKGLSTYLENLTDRPIIWCKGTDFDVAILGHAYRQAGLPIPWKYNDVRDFRTVKKLFASLVDPAIENEEAHDALCDAIFQARQLHSIQLVLK